MKHLKDGTGMRHLLHRRAEQIDRCKPINLNIQGKRMRIIHSKEPSGIYTQFDPLNERLPTVSELMSLRISAFKEACASTGGIRKMAADGNDHLETRDFPPIWRFRLTTSTMMVRASDKSGIDSVFFYDGNPFDTYGDLAAALNGKLIDGGLRYGSRALEKIRQETPFCSVMPVEDYLKARGGNYPAYELLDHPVCKAITRDPALLEKYLYVLDTVDLEMRSFYHRGLHSIWCPRELKTGFGRPYALGFKGEAFYPPNNAAIGHAALLLPAIYENEKNR